MSILLTLLLTCLVFSRSQWLWTFSVQLMISSLNDCLLIASISMALFLRSAQDLIFLRQIHCKIAWLQIKGCKKSARLPSCVTYCTPVLKICLVLLSTIESRYYNCCADGSSSPGNYRYVLVLLGRGDMQSCGNLPLSWAEPAPSVLLQTHGGSRRLQNAHDFQSQYMTLHKYTEVCQFYLPIITVHFIKLSLPWLSWHR
jgi:hypothetical protein